MIPEIGNFSLMLALVLALILGILPITGSLRGNRQLMALARPVARGQLAFIVTAFGCLVYTFVTNDFSVKYVASTASLRCGVGMKARYFYGC